MGRFDDIVERAMEAIYGDERLRSNLTDNEARIVLDWATTRIGAQIQNAKDEANARKASQNEVARVLPVVQAINSLAKKAGTLRLSEAVATLEPLLHSGMPFTRSEVLGLLVGMADVTLQMRKDQTRRGR